MNLATCFSVGFSILLLCSSAAAFQAKDVEAKAVTQADKQADKNDEKKTEKAPETVTAKKKSLQIFEQFNGVIESFKTGEVKADAKSWTDLTIKKILDEGTQVKDGEAVLWFETDKIDEALKEAEFTLEGAQLDHKEAELTAAQAEIEFNLDNDLNTRDMNQAREDYDYYQNVQRREQLSDLDYQLKSSNYFVEYSKEELDQLMKMYNEDELTEESEKIVLKRAQRSVESAERGLHRSELSVKRTKETEIPRQDIQRQAELKRKALVFEKKKQTLPYNLDRAKIALEKSSFALQKAQKKVAELKADRELMVLKAPMDGLLYYGRCERGKWSGVSGSGATTLEPGKKIPARKVVLTVVDPASLIVRAEIDEDKIAYLGEGVRGTAVMKSNKKILFPVVVESLKRIPVAAGKFDCKLEMAELENSNLEVLPALNCNVSVKIYENENAIVVPKASVFSDDGINHYVYTTGETPKRKEVEVGMTSGDDIEIVAGLSEGDKILKSKP